MNLGKSIQSLRKRQRLTQEALAGRAGLSRPSLSQIENNGYRPSGDTLKRICAALEVPESLVYINAFEREDVPASKQGTYDLVFPLIQDMILRVADEGPKNGNAAKEW
ncbi:MAG: helix-turn-helix transcriptional regulator [Bacteroidota bacterium]|nr:helix-turn-helix transcriptional regulator [Bacteroidota bacterium]MDP4215310.1 helix-turn-helix transcriptional regulator [Bacteroidota bacterium]MDP4247207.1 helix-turn-helix transcriptional regulator [Bacteroidota bacterium]MDP4252873.1 helix-turn-helix transcriptional regulator [Bacteroidota bacterium]MDP4259138.1 helix-turn-helix transcriptional regulator [Bacteroidota bacterium]